MQKGILGSRKENIKKGITPVIAIILLLLITISMVGVSFVFMQRIRQTAEQSGEKMLDQQLTQFGTQFKIEGVDKNKVYIRNTGSVDLKDLAFYVNNVKVDSNNPMIAINTIGTISLNDAQLAQLPDPAELKVTSAGFTNKITADFYGKYTAGYWKFDEGSGTVVSDSSGNGNDGTLVNNPAWVDGKYGKALQFDGSNDYVDAGNAASLTPANTFTIDMWVRFATLTPNFQVMMSQVVNVGERWMVFYDKVNGFGFYMASGATEINLRQGSASGWSTDTWYHVAIIRNGNSWTATRDGTSVATLTDSDSVPDFAAPLEIGRQNLADPNKFYFNGYIDEVRILNVARSMSTS